MLRCATHTGMAFQWYTRKAHKSLLTKENWHKHRIIPFGFWANKCYGQLLLVCAIWKQFIIACRSAKLKTQKTSWPQTVLHESWDNDWMVNPKGCFIYSFMYETLGQTCAWCLGYSIVATRKPPKKHTLLDFFAISSQLTIQSCFCAPHVRTKYRRCIGAVIWRSFWECIADLKRKKAGTVERKTRQDECQLETEVYSQKTPCFCLSILIRSKIHHSASML